MKKLIFLLFIVFIVLTFVGAFYVLSNRGMVNAGYAVIPMVLSIACLNIYNTLKNKWKAKNGSLPFK